MGNGFPCSQTDAVGQFWDLGSHTSRGKSWTWSLASWIKWSFSNSHRSHLWYKNPLPTSLLSSHMPRIKNPTHCNYKKSQVHLGMKTMAEWLAVHQRCVPPFTCMDWILVIGCPVKNYISQLSLQLDGDIPLSSCQKIVGRNDVCHFQGWPIKTSSKVPHDLLGSLSFPHQLEAKGSKAHGQTSRWKELVACPLNAHIGLLHKTEMNFQW